MTGQFGQDLKAQGRSVAKVEVLTVGISPVQSNLPPTDRTLARELRDASATDMEMSCVVVDVGEFGFSAVA